MTSSPGAAFSDAAGLTDLGQLSGHCQIREYQKPAFALTGMDPQLNAIIADVQSHLPNEVIVRSAKDDYVPASDGSYHIPLAFFLDGIPFCSSQFYATAHKTSGRTWFKGHPPIQEYFERQADLSVPASLSADNLSQLIEPYLGRRPSEASLLSQLSCIYYSDGKLRRVTEASVNLDRQPYQLITLGDKVLELNPEFLHATGSFLVYKSGNRLSNSTVELSVPDLQDNGYLCSQVFTADTNGAEASYSHEYNFKFDTNDKRFLEAALFANASSMMQWFLQLSPNAHWSAAQVELRLTDEQFYEESGPFYANPSFKGSLKRPVIVVPNQMTVAQKDSAPRPILTNLASDFDVVAHELGHHIVSQYVGTSRSSDSLMVHEGLADFFVFAQTGNDCLGESICTNNSGICVRGNECLRTADTSLSYRQPGFAGLEAHLQSQLVSGMLWQIGKSKGVGLEHAAKLVLQGIRYLDKETDPIDLVNALFQADEELFQGADNCLIQKEAERRGITDYDKGRAKANCPS